MNSFINKYNNLEAYNADEGKQYPNVSYIVDNDIIKWEKVKPFRLKLFYENGDEYTLEIGEGKKQDYISPRDVERGINSSSDPHHKSHIVKAIIGDYETSLGSYAGMYNQDDTDVFENCNNLEEVVFGKSLKLICNECFYNCQKLFENKDLILPETIEYIGQSAFKNENDITNKRKLFIPKKLTSYIQQNNSNDGNYVSSFCSSYYKNGFERIIGPENTVYDSRENCNCLINSKSNMLLFAAQYNAFLLSTVTKINDRGFKYSDITSVDLNNVISIGESAFEECANLENVTIGSSLTTLPRKSFYETNWRDIVIPSNITSIYEMNTDGVDNSSVFNRSSKIDSITVDSNNPVYDSRENCNAIIKTDENKMIYNSKNTTLPSTVKKIGYCVYDEYPKLTTIDLSNITHIQAYAFRRQDQLTEINLPSIVEIENSFDYCSKLQKVDFGENVEKIKGFYNNIGESKLNTIICRSTTPPTLEDYTFSDSYEKNKTIQNIYVPDESVDLYKAANNWSKYVDEIKPLSEYVAS